MPKSRPAAAALTLAVAAVALVPAVAWSAPAPTTVADPSDGPVLHGRDDLPAYEPPAPVEVEPDQVLVRFAPSASESDQSSTLSAAGVTGAGKAVPGTKFVAVPVGDEDAATVVERLAADPDVADVQVDHVRHGFGWTNDPLLSYTWPYLDLTRQPRAWETSTQEPSTGQGVVVAVLDSGVDATHEDLAARMLPGWDFVENDATPTDPNGHGTLVAGTAAASGDNGKGTVGVAYGASILPVRVLDAAGNSTDSRVAAGIAWAVSNGADVINLSLGGPGASTALRDAVQAAVNAGVVVVAAAGNEGDQVRQYPAAYAPQIPGLLSVSATDYWGALAGWSTWGDTVSIAAPGNDVVGPGTGGGYVIGSGTSFAAPIVSGAAALVLARTPTLSPADVERRLVSTTRDAGPRGYDPYYGAGLLDVAAAATATSTHRAAPGVALDRAPADPGSSDDTPATARALTGGAATATLSPEGDVDWYTVDVPAAGTYRAHVGQTSAGDPSTGPLLDPVVQVQNASGAVLGQADDGEAGEPEDLFVRVAAAGTLRVGVWNANGSAPADRTYEVRVEQGPTAPFTPTFTAPADPTRTNVGVLAAGDVTGDGKDDAVTVELGGGVYVYPGAGDGTLRTPVDVPVPGISIDGHGVAVADLTGDGTKDAVATTATGFVLLRQVSGVLTVGAQTPVTFGGAAQRGFDIATVDWDKDNDQDVVVSTGRPSIQVFRNNGSGVFTPIAEALSEQYLAVGDVTGDGRPDVVTTHAVHPQAADGTLAAPVTLPFAGGPLVTAVAVGDVTGDGRLDVVRLNGSAVRVDAALAGGGFAPTKEYPAGGESGGDLVVGKIDGDSRDDVLVSNAFDMRVSLLRQLPDGKLSEPGPSPVEQTVYDQPGQLALAQLDADGRVDAVLAQSGVIALRQTVLSTPTTPGWSISTSPAPHASGVGVRPTVRVGFARDLLQSDVDGGHVRLLDATGSTVPSSVTWDAPSRTVRVTPSADLTPGGHYSVVVSDVRDTATPAAALPAPVRVPFTVAAGGDRYTPVEPFRIVDTRDPAVPEAYGPVRSGERLVVSFAGLVPTDATAVVMGITSTRHNAIGNVRAFPTNADGSGPAPLVSNVNVVPGVDQPNLATVQLGPGQTIAVMPDGPTTDLVLDVFGYYSPGGATGYVPLTPRRVLDTRLGVGAPAGVVLGGRWVDLQVTGGGVPADATAVVLNVVGTGVQGGTFVTVMPTPDLGEPWTGPATSNLNLYPGRDQANLVTVKVGEGGQVRLFVNRWATHLVADIAGYYTSTGTSGLVPVAPARLADSRVPVGFTGPLRAGTPVDVKVGGTSAVPAGATAAVVNIAGVSPRNLTHVRVFPTTVPASLPDISSINLVPGRDEANMAILTLGVEGKSTFYAQSSDLHMVVDVFGWFRTYR